MEILLIANPENRRADFFTEAARHAGVDTRVVSWLDVLDGAAVDAEHIRIESPGENWAVESALTGRDEPEDLGRIRALDVAYHRFVEVLGALPKSASYMTAPSAVAAMFDKVESKRRLAEVGVDVPRTLGVVRRFDEVRELARKWRRGRFFVKPRHGSSASGVIAMNLRDDRVLAVTSAEMDGERLYNSLRIRRYQTFDEVERLVNLLGAEDELLVEEWVPKGSFQNATFDLRVVAIADRAEHAVVRLSRHPMTNLHLGNARGDLAALQSELGPQWTRVQALASQALGAFDGALYAGVDVGLSPDRRRAVVFEVNAFGDLVPGIVDDAGHDTYQAELAAYLSRIEN